MRQPDIRSGPGRNRDRAARIRGVVFLFLLACGLVAVSDVAFHLTGSGDSAARLKSDMIGVRAWLTNSVLLFGIFALVYSVTARLITSALLVAPLFFAFVAASIAKIRFIHSAVQPFDLLRIPEFLPLFRSFFGTPAMVIVVATLVIWAAAVIISARGEGPSAGPKWRLKVAAVSLLIVGALPTAFFLRTESRSLDSLLIWLGAPESTHREAARQGGMLLTFVSELPAVRVQVPYGYSEDRIASIVARHPAGDTSAFPLRANIIVYLVESFMDPDDLGFSYTSDPIPTVRSLQGANGFRHAIVPAAFAGSSRSEFELLTGMATGFLPPESLPYRQYLRRPIPALPRVLSEQGYLTVAVQADPRYYYDRERAYDLLGFEHVRWLHGAPGIEQAERGRWPSDRAVVEALFESTSGNYPFFAFAFPSSSHSPYNFGSYEASSLDVSDSLSPAVRREVKEYINALHVADRSIARLVDHFKASRDPTIIAIVGDHLPPLTAEALAPFNRRQERLSERERFHIQRRVPLVVWANFDIEAGDPVVSLDALPAMLLTRAGVGLPVFFASSRDVHERVPILSRFILRGGQPGSEWNSLPPQSRDLLIDHHLLQHDLLVGSQYSMEPADRRPSSAEHRR
jgi:hypothetical protein